MAPTVLTSEQAREYLGISERTLRRLTGTRQLAYSRIGTLVRFRLADLDAFLARTRVEAVRLPGGVR